MFQSVSILIIPEPVNILLCEGEEGDFADVIKARVMRK